MATALLVFMAATGCVEIGENTGSSPARLGGTGPITMATGTDFTGYLQPLVNRWNSAHPAERVTLLEVADAADEQRAQLVTNLQAKSERYDVLNLDVVWTAEFADAGWIVPLDRRRFPMNEFFPPAIESAMYKGTLYAVPYTSNAGMLYYRADILRKHGARPPRTWSELRQLAKTIAPKEGIKGYAGQFLPYEGLSVNFAEAVQSEGGAILTGEGTNVVVDSPQARAGLTRLVDGFREGWIPREALRYREEESRLEFQRGRLLFLRNWPYAYGIFDRAGPDNEIKGKFGVTLLPGSDGHPGAGSLGGQNLAISAYSRHQKTALRFITYLTGLDSQREVLARGSFPPVWTRLYDDPELIGRFPYLPVLKRSIVTARSRPKSPNYNQVTLIVYSGVYDALASRKNVNATLSQMGVDLKGAIAGS
jgi:multiple sugar transport system substrate-binding protein